MSCALGCAEVSQEPLALSPSPSEETTEPSAAGQPNDPAPAITGPGWCEARAVLAAKCQRCHGEVPENGAPFSLVTYEDTQVETKKGTRFERIATALTQASMPPTYLQLSPPVEELSADEASVLLEWCEAGAPPDADGDCSVSE